MKRERRRFVISIRAKQQSDGERRGEERRGDGWFGYVRAEAKVLRAAGSGSMNINSTVRVEASAQWL